MYRVASTFTNGAETNELNLRAVYRDDSDGDGNGDGDGDGDSIECMVMGVNTDLSLATTCGSHHKDIALNKYGKAIAYKYTQRIEWEMSNDGDGNGDGGRLQHNCEQFLTGYTVHTLRTVRTMTIPSPISALHHHVIPISV